jgi:nitrite reductase (NADH) small subunit
MSDTWIEIGGLEDIPPQGSRVVKTPSGDVAVFRTADDQVFALHDKCPHKGGPLSQGIVHGTSVTCPLHNWVIGLETGEAKGNDKGCSKRFDIKLVDGRLFLDIVNARRAVA